MTHYIQAECPLDDLVANVEQSWAEYPAEKIDRAFQNKALTIDRIIEYQGGNRFEVPHVSADAREARLPAMAAFDLSE